MRCIDCGVVTRSPSGKSWKKQKCRTCIKPKNQNAGEIMTPERHRTGVNPVDIYLDLGTLHELRTIDK